jgi:hypothetical protein
MRVCEQIKDVIWENKTKPKKNNDMHVPILLHSKGARLKRNKHKKVSFDPRTIIF